MARMTGNEMGDKLCEVFKQPPDRVQSIAVTAEAGGLATATITRLVHDDELQQIYTLFEYFNLVKKDEHKQVHPQGIMGPGGEVPEATDEWSKLAREALEQEGQDDIK